MRHNVDEMPLSEHISLLLSYLAYYVAAAVVVVRAVQIWLHPAELVC